MLTLEHVSSKEDPLIATARELFLEYSDELAIDLCFQGFQEELDALPGKYSPPGGAILIAYWSGEVAGCGAIRSLDDCTGELKRIYVRPDFRGRKLGEALTIELLRLAREIGYSTVKLDTLRRLQPALALYKKLGFNEIAPYNINPEPDIVYLEIDL